MVNCVFGVLAMTEQSIAEGKNIMNNIALLVMEEREKGAQGLGSGVPCEFTVPPMVRSSTPSQMA